MGTRYLSGAKYGPRDPPRAIYEPGGQGVTETPIASKGLNLGEDMQIYCKDRDMYGGGVAIIINKKLHPQEIPNQQIPVPPVPTQHQFNLTGITPPVPPKWKHNENLLNDYRKFRHSYQ